MKNLYLTPADFWKERDFGAKISAVFEFIGVHWRLLGKCLVYFALPFALLMGIGLGSFNNTTYNQAGRVMAARRAATVLTPTGSSPFSMLGAGGGLLGLLAGMLAFLVLAGTVYGFIRARLDTPADVPLTPALVWAQLRQRLGRTLLMVLLAGAAYLALVVAVVGGIIYATRGGSPDGGTIALLVLLGFVAFAGISYLAVVFALYFPVLWFEDGGVFATIGRCFQLIQGKWWSTFGLLFVAGLIQSFISVIFAIPQYAVMIGKMVQVPYLNSDLLGIFTYCFYALGITFTYTIPLLAVGFQYFNLVERREGRGLRLLLDELGQPAATPTAHSSHYRPDEEGEY